MLVIEDVRVYEVLDSRGNPIVETEVVLSDGSMGVAIVPSGTSTDFKKALELRDNDERSSGKGVLKAVSNVNEAIADEVLGLDALNQAQLDDTLRELDDTNSYSRSGANATLGVSMTATHAAASALGVPLYRYLGGTDASISPMPMCNIINGGTHTGNNIDFREFMVIPFGFTSFKKTLRSVCEIYTILRKELASLGHSAILGDKEGSAPDLANNTEPIDLLVICAKKVGYENRVKTALDVTSIELFKGGKYHMEGKAFSSEDLIERYMGLCTKYPICSIEDDLAGNDFEGRIKLTEELGDKIRLMGNDSFVTNKDILRRGIIKKMANTVLTRPNQIGTITQTMRTVRLAQRSNYKYMMGHRSGESEDVSVTDFAVTLNTGQIKTRASARGERTAEYDRLLGIELESDEYLGEKL